MVLTERQKKDLNVAILEYLLSEGTVFSNTISALKDEAKISDIPDLSRNILEKKWTSVVRLQRKVMELEAKLEAVQHQSSSNGSLRPGSGIQTGFNEIDICLFIRNTLH
jgi:platelet-activating factor acetylhydrolase IB subunit alpha